MIKIEFKGFEWDQGNRPKIQKRFEINQVEEFFNQKLLIIKDSIHSKSEERFIATGLGPNEKPMFVCFTLRSHYIRVISARFMKTKEAMKYENFKKDF